MVSKPLVGLPNISWTCNGNTPAVSPVGPSGVDAGKYGQFNNLSLFRGLRRHIEVRVPILKLFL